ncbi:MAG: adenylate/guanylate cyclase domain-containing protein [Anaerolineales bacterium]|nr:MAG: adenylate/guanylate cyclase domain-containing protein [Anaerolineales bacterium]
MKTKKNTLNLNLILLAGTVILLLIIQAAALLPGVTTPLESLEYSTRDFLMRLRGPQTSSDDIVIVAIDDFSFQWTGYQWPWSRSYLAEIVDQINAGGAKVVGVDILLFEPDADPGGDEAFSEALGESQYAINILQITRRTDQQFTSQTLSQPLSLYRQVLDGTGITSFVNDEDAIVRSVQAFTSFNEALYFNWAFDAARLYLDVEPPSLTTQNRILFNGQIIPLSREQLLVNFAGPAGTYTTYSAANVALGDVLEQNPDAFRNKIVLIGATTDTMQDVHPTPFSTQNPTPGVEIVANTIDTLINGKYLTITPPWMALLITLGAALLAYLITLSKRPTLTISLLIVAMIGYVAAAFTIFVRQRYILPVIIPEIMLFLGVILPSLEQAVSQELEKRRVRNLFSRFISPEMVDQMMMTQDLNSLNKRADVSILFSDIRGFTTLSERMTPEEVVALLNPYLEAMSKVINQHGGTVDKYEGDAIIAFFGEPVPYKDHAVRALRAALDMRKALTELKEKWEDEGRPSNIEMGIGINSGEVFVGLLGSEQRINYTVIGDNANLASRLQDLTKTYAWPILISESTYQQVKDEFETELVDSVTVKGKTQAVNVYKVLGWKDTEDSEKLSAWQKA